MKANCLMTKGCILIIQIFQVLTSSPTAWFW